MNKKTFIIAVSIVAALAIAIATFALWPRSNSNDVGAGAVYELTEDDRIEVDSISRDFITRTTDFGLIVEDDSQEAKAHRVYDLALAIGGEDFSPFFKTRYSTIRSATELLAPEASFYPGSSPYDSRTDEDLFGYRQFESKLNNLSVPANGNQQVLSRGEEVPSVGVKVELESIIRDRSPRTMESNGDENGDIYAPGWTINEREKLVKQDFTLQLIKSDAGWKVYNIVGAKYPEVLAAFTPIAKNYEETMITSSEVTYEYKFDGDEHDHEH